MAVNAAVQLPHREGWHLIGAFPDHEPGDVVTVFRGVAMTGDIGPGMLESVTDGVPLATRRRSMRRLRGFEERTGYHVHSVVSAHLNDVRVSVRWPDLFDYRPARG
jgi:hypothetical protein